MTTHTKIAVTVPERTLRAVEAARRRLGRSRSSIVAEALEAWLDARGSGEADRAYLAGYQRFPEPDDGSVAAAVMASWDSWEAAPTSSRAGEGKRRRRS